MIGQSQESLTDQLHQVRHLANANGLYDAADWLSKQLYGLEGITPPKKRECKNCGSTNAVERVRYGDPNRFWCSHCGYWADRKKPDA